MTRRVAWMMWDVCRALGVLEPPQRQSANAKKACTSCPSSMAERSLRSLLLLHVFEALVRETRKTNCLISINFTFIWEFIYFHPRCKLSTNHAPSVCFVYVWNLLTFRAIASLRKKETQNHAKIAAKLTNWYSLCLNHSLNALSELWTCPFNPLPYTFFNCLSKTKLKLTINHYKLEKRYRWLIVLALRSLEPQQTPLSVPRSRTYHLPNLTGRSRLMGTISQYTADIKQLLARRVLMHCGCRKEPQGILQRTLSWRNSGPVWIDLLRNVEKSPLLKVSDFNPPASVMIHHEPKWLVTTS